MAKSLLTDGQFEAIDGHVEGDILRNLNAQVASSLVALGALAKDGMWSWKVTEIGENLALVETSIRNAQFASAKPVRRFIWLDGASRLAEVDYYEHDDEFAERPDGKRMRRSGRLFSSRKAALKARHGELVESRDSAKYDLKENEEWHPIRTRRLAEAETALAAFEASFGKGVE